MALRSLIEIPITLLPFPAIFSSSPMVETSMRRGDEPVSPGRPPSSCTVGSETLVTVWAVSRSYQSLPMIPLSDGGAPLRKVEWPIAVTVR